MRRFYSIANVLIISVLALFVSSCGKTQEELIPQLKIFTNPEKAAAHSQFVSVTASGEWTIQIDYQGKEPWFTIEPSSGNGNLTTVILKVSENTGDRRSATITIRGKEKYSTLDFVQNGASQGGGNEPGGDTGGNTGGGSDNPSGVSTAAKADWLELPETSTSDKFDFFTHYMTISGTRTRNYSFYWDYDNLVAPWVAYTMSKWNVNGSSGRTDAWELDPLLPASKQPVLYRGFSGYSGAQIARGHQIASADRQVNRDANMQTFYFTNMTPQLQNGLNGDIWANLESKFRGWAASCDTLYVVTGCVTKGSTRTVTDNVGKRVTVPVGYYKAALRYSKSSTLGWSGYIGFAVYLEQRAYSERSITKQMSMSIDQLEEKLGIDLFVNLPAKVGKENADKIEAQLPSGVNWWW